jgi:hypothetical protein
MEEFHDVVLHVYDLQTPDAEQMQQATNTSRGGSIVSFFSKLLPTIGMGAYHTCVEVMNDRYTFAANAGIVKTRSSSQGVPSGANYKEAIFLGACSVPNRGALQDIIQKLSESFFTPTSYHLVHRNCNHFAETFATAIILYDSLAEPGQHIRLKTFPEWINRLANTSKVVVSHDEDIVPCNVLAEARKAVGAEEKIGWNFTEQKKAANGKKNSKPQASASAKKELTEKQKAALAKIRQK